MAGNSGELGDGHLCTWQGEEAWGWQQCMTRHGTNEVWAGHVPPIGGRSLSEGQGLYDHRELALTDPRKTHATTTTTWHDLRKGPEGAQALPKKPCAKPRRERMVISRMHIRSVSLHALSCNAGACPSIQLPGQAPAEVRPYAAARPSLTTSWLKGPAASRAPPPLPRLRPLPQRPSCPKRALGKGPAGEAARGRSRTWRCPTSRRAGPL